MEDNNKRFFGRKIYALQFSDEEASHGIVIKVEFWNKKKPDGSQGFKGICYLEPQDRGHMIRGEIIEEHEWGFIFRSDGYKSGNWTFTEVSLDSFIECYGRGVMGGSSIAKEMKNTTELQDWFYKKFLDE